MLEWLSALSSKIHPFDIAGNLPLDHRILTISFTSAISGMWTRRMATEVAFVQDRRRRLLFQRIIDDRHLLVREYAVAVLRSLTFKFSDENAET